MRTCSLIRFTLVSGIIFFVSVTYAAVITFQGADNGANSTDARPNSDAAAAAFDAAAAGLGAVSHINFETAPVGSFSSLVVAPGVTLTGADHNGFNQSILNSPFSTPDGLFGYNTTAGGSEFAFMYGGYITITFASPIQAFGAYLSGIQFATETITFSDGSSQSVLLLSQPISSGGIQFDGFTDAGKLISAITVNVDGDFVGMDDIRYVSSVQSMPDAGASGLLLGLGVASLAVFRKRLSR